MRFKLLVTAISALAMATLALVIRMGEDSNALPASPKNSAESRKPDAPMSGFGLAERLADDPHAALEWLLQTSGREQSTSLSADPHLQSAVIDAANRLMQTIGPQSGQENSVALGNFVQRWASVDLRSAYEWVHQIPAGQVRNALMVRVAFVGSQIAPAEAASLVVEELPPGVTQEEAAMMVLHQWALQDPDSAAAWVNLFPDDAFRHRALSELQGVTYSQRTSLAAP
ncbi:MAG TPA: hypothetical protein VLE43_19250 [Candidatus Saccharimonadia bacterium]|nr:hypothetical protein [Candidatus Saccharimonadia bacterium]